MGLKSILSNFVDIHYCVGLTNGFNVLFRGLPPCMGVIVLANKDVDSHADGQNKTRVRGYKHRDHDS